MRAPRDPSAHLFLEREQIVAVTSTEMERCATCPSPRMREDVIRRTIEFPEERTWLLQRFPR